MAGIYAPDGSEYVTVVGGVGAPTTAKYIVQTADATLTAEQSLGALTTGLLLNTVTASTGVLTTAPQTGTGNVVFSASPTLTGTLTAATVSATSLGASGGVQGTTFLAASTAGGLILLGAGNDVIISRKSAAGAQLGGADAASPVAQSLNVQSVVAGTSNTAGVDWTFKASASTGTGVGGKLIFQTTPAGSTGTTVNTLVTGLTIDPTTGSSVIARGTNTNDDAASGIVGEILIGSVLVGSAISISTATDTNVTSVVLTPGDYDVFGSIGYVPDTTTSITKLDSSLSTTTATRDQSIDRWETRAMAAVVPGGGVVTSKVPGARFSVSSAGNQTVYLVGRATFSISTMTVYGKIWARRVR